MKSNEQDLDSYYRMVANQPFVEQILHQTSFMSEDELHLSSDILGCKFLIIFSKDIEILLVAETLLAFLEGFFATSMNELMSFTETIIINLKRSEEIYSLEFTYNELNGEYDVSVNTFNVTTESKSCIWDSLLELVTDILIKHFIAKDLEHFVSNLFEKEEINERLSLIIKHRDLSINLLGDKPKLFFNDWQNYLKPEKYISIQKNILLTIKILKK